MFKLRKVYYNSETKSIQVGNKRSSRWLYIQSLAICGQIDLRRIYAQISDDWTILQIKLAL